MSETVIKVENVSKQYRLGDVGTGTLSHDLNRWWHRVRGKPDPYIKVTESNDRTKNSLNSSNSRFKSDADYVWALRDINFEVKRGEVLGIIGRNGAGKSTLLKILSRVTAPTEGCVKVKGRIGALLEVGTGFHPELTGRENIYLNGAILGMTKAEVTSRLDEIIDFSGCERYLDTPVKRYSSGMLVRLAFSVAAHLDPEILIVDEVLAVGDMAFQNKCLGKMDDVANSGRTVLFVSHNMTAVGNLCSRSLVLDDGRLVFDGQTQSAIDHYRDLSAGETSDESSIYIDDDAFKTNSDYRVISVELLSEAGNPLQYVATGAFVCIRIHYQVKSTLSTPSIGLRFLSRDQQPLMRFVNDACGFSISELPKGKGYVDCNIPRLPFTRGTVLIDIDLGVRGSELFHHITNAVRINVVEGDFYGSGVPFDSSKQHGFFVCEHSWSSE